ncbi:DUF2513 domain-containing protein [Hoeflea sp. Naph1]|uniref:DUF2513 domain-containing protein n=1 Tax=Hoeflea sp. Naph1 TaxID=3388653 RepID=UPI00398FD03B
MKRDDDYIRQLLLESEASSEPYLMAVQHLSMTTEEQKRHQHAELLCDAGFFEAVNKGVYRITNQGHDYLAAVRSDTVWNKTKESAGQLGGVTLGIMRDLAVGYIKQEAKIKLGIDLG